MLSFALFVLVGLCAGVLAGIFGIGGGLVIVPALIWLARMDTKTAIGTSLGALLLPVGLLGANTYWRAGQLDVKASLCVAVGLLFGTLFGARLAAHVDGVMVQRGFAVLLVVVAARLWITAQPKAPPAAEPVAEARD